MANMIKTALRTIRVLGIDLGTTNSTIAEVRWESGGAARLITAWFRGRK
jgi:molecular chaperone DnaK (HSP70)